MNLAMKLRRSDQGVAVFMFRTAGMFVKRTTITKSPYVLLTALFV
jgi:hypothetical protein